ncbi:MAG: fumarate reductase [marine bacterium B5-7]|nr:MAG: fumarate reductase [marine bacterium B5-7]
MSDGQLQVHVWRGGEKGALKTYSVSARDNQTVLDVVTEIQQRIDPTLSYRFACRVGVCGSCAMTVNGRPRWTCRTHVTRVAINSELTIEPLRNLPHIKDLITDMAPFFEKWQRAGGVFEGTATRHDPPASVTHEDRQRRNADAGIECINCAVCYSACDVAGWNKDYLGPAALNRAWTLLNDCRHGDHRGLLAVVSAAGGCSSCHTQGRCTEACPVELSPTRSIAGLKRATLLNTLGLATDKVAS